MTRFKDLLIEIEHINKMVEFERSMNGNDDELEDEV
eukprot:CAMPEP_0116874540 /NCGR_PEP_ID=MMETSP0463-20121206/6008_1 /TAXON_ID=181622 /ORGANISM="Strombidinopsis sp, Strain SopsisLIS2011" /LENGTH=35 /DNA_ID= /DNA_START= /DNA_END= /DNA_ORIENTATION=